MSGLDVEALLDSTAASASKDQDNRPKGHDRDDRHKGERSERRDRDRHRDASRDRDRDRKRRERSRDRKRDRDGDEEMKSPNSERGSANGSHRSRKRSRSRDDDRRHSRRDRHGEDGYRSSGGDFYRGAPRGRSRSKSPGDDRYYRPGANGRPRRDDTERDDDRARDRRDRPVERRRSASPKKRAKSKTPEPQLTEDERDRRTVFVQQLAARLRTKELIQFFEKVGPVKEAQIVKDRVSGRSKGYDAPKPLFDLMLTLVSVGYVEFKQEESVPLAIQLTGQKLLGIPIIAQLTEAEKNRQARNPEASSGNHNSIPFHRLYVGNIHFSITESDLQNVFEPFGELEFVQLQKEEMGRSRGYGFVQ
jgi:RNA-binding protein 23/39